MRWDEIDIQKMEWRIPKTKNGEAQSIPLSAEAIEVIQGIPPVHQCPWLFPASSASGHLESPQKQWAAVLKEAELKDVRMHDLRRTLGSWQAMTGASLLMIGKALGHKSQAATKVYARLDMSPVRESIQKATTAMLSRKKPEEP
jgi:integrase